MIQLELAGRDPDRRRELVEKLQRSREARGLHGLSGASPDDEGFAIWWDCTAEQLATVGAIVFAEEPLLRWITIEIGSRDAQKEMRRLAATPMFARVRRLLILSNKSARIRAKGLAILTESPHWPRLECLRLVNGRIGDDGAELLARSASLSDLRWLDLWSNAVMTKGVTALARSPHLGNLHTLNLWSNRPGPDGLLALASADNKMQLDRLDLDEQDMFAEPVAALRKRFPGIEIRNKLPDAAPPAPPVKRQLISEHRERIGEQLARSPADRALRQIYADALIEEGGVHALRGELIQREVAGRFDGETHDVADRVKRAREARGLTGFGLEGLAEQWLCSLDELIAYAELAFAEEPLLRRVVIYLPPGEAPRMHALANVPELARVRELSISVGERHVAPGVEGVFALLSSPYWPSLAVLQLASCNLGDAGAKLLAEMASLSELKELDLSYNDIGSQGVAALAGSRHLGNLRSLCLTGNRIGPDGIAVLASDANQLRLDKLELDDTGTHPALAQPIAQRFPDLHLVLDPIAVPPPPPPPANEDDDDDDWQKGPFV